MIGNSSIPPDYSITARATGIEKLATATSWHIIRHQDRLLGGAELSLVRLTRRKSLQSANNIILAIAGYEQTVYVVSFALTISAV